MYTARYLGVENFGVLSFALAFSGIYGVLTDLGLNSLTVREVARNASMSSKYIGNILTIKVILAVLTFGLMALTINSLDYPRQTIKVVYFISFSVIFGSLSSFLYSIFQAHEKMEYQSLGVIINSALMLVATLFGISKKFDVVYFAFIPLLANAIVLIYTLVLCTWKFSLPKISFDWEFWKTTINRALPFGLSMIFITIYYWIDSVMLSMMIGDEVVGLYNAAYRLVVVLLVIPSILNIAIFPVMSRFYVTAKDSLIFVYEKYFKYMAIIGFPIGVGTTLLAEKIILSIFGIEYLDSVIALQILVWSSVFIFLSGSFGRLFESSDRQIIITVITGICAVENVLLNLIIIPRFSYAGASATTVITELTSLIFCIIASSKILHISPKNNLLNTIKPILASLLMGIFILELNNLNLLLLILLSISVYFLSLYLMRGFEKVDVNLFKSIIKNEAGDRK